MIKGIDVSEHNGVIDWKKVNNHLAIKPQNLVFCGFIVRYELK